MILHDKQANETGGGTFPMFRLPLFILMAVVLSACTTSIGNFFNSSASNEQVVPKASRDGGYQLGKDQLMAGNYGLAINSFENALSRNPKSIDTLNGLGIAYAKIGRKDAATRYFEEALKIDPRSPVTLNNIGYFHLTNGTPMTALSYARRAVNANEVATTTGTPELSMMLTTALKNNFVHAQAAAGIAAAPAQSVVLATSKKRMIQAGREVMADGSAHSGGYQAIVNEGASSRPQDNGKSASTTTATIESENVPPTFRISNGAGFRGLAAKTAHWLDKHGLHAGLVTNEPRFDRRYSLIFYNPGLRSYAIALAHKLPMHPQIVEAKHGTGHVELILGADAQEFAGRLDLRKSGA